MQRNSWKGMLESSSPNVIRYNVRASNKKKNYELNKTLKSKYNEFKNNLHHFTIDPFHFFLQEESKVGICLNTFKSHWDS